ncbi:blood group Rh(CE) polypeptide isoform X1 [Halichoerus grypus]|uniref:blood group Rh(CE) polypeptide isoform X1 n=2 Tax=Halichoerus grypus TaxID=9711 RepID=UPI00165940DA|nr:blood group Rh(CE) polypeptide isoform X1 [Halichoerus grypus]
MPHRHRQGHRMGSKYPPSMRGCLPLWILVLEVALIVIFFFFTSSDTSSQDPKKLMGNFRVLQDVTIMAALGFGFLNSSLRRYGWSSVAFNLFLLALGVQWAVLMDGFLEWSFRKKVVIKLSSIKLATMSAMSVLISAGAVLGKANLLQLTSMALVEVTVFVTMRMIDRQYLSLDGHVSMMHVHVFATYFGLMVAWFLSRSLNDRVTEEKNQTTKSSSLFTMLGTLFLWIFWPSFNSALLDIPKERRNAVFNTYYAVASSAVTAISMSSLARPQGKINMTHIHNAVLAGGVAVGPSCHLITSPWLAMLLGFMAGLISIGGALCLPEYFNHVLGIHDTCGVHYTFGLPGLLGGIAYILLIIYEVTWTKQSMISYQVFIGTGTLSLAVASGLIAGVLTGLVLNLKICKGPHAANYFDDQAFWEFPHLAIGF